MDDTLCTCEWRYVWHRFEGNTGVEQRDATIIRYDPHCPHHDSLFSRYYPTTEEN